MATGRLPDPNTAPVTAKGDLYTYSTVPAKLAVGNNGETLVADSSASTGLRWQGNFAAGKNKVINGAFDIWQRGTSGAGTFLADRFQYNSVGGDSYTQSRQTFTPGAAPVAGYEAQYFHRTVITVASGYAQFSTNLEDVRTFAGQTVTLSFWAKADTNTRNYGVNLDQNFGSGGSATVTSTLSTASLTTSWVRYSSTISLPSISGKTIGTNSMLSIRLVYSGVGTFDIWGIQLEAGNVATAFQTATGTLAGELCTAQRYYFRWNAADSYSIWANGYAYSTTACNFTFNAPVKMRVKPTSVDFSNIGATIVAVATTGFTGLAIGNECTSDVIGVQATGATGLTQYRPYSLGANNSTSAYIGFSAEL